MPTSSREDFVNGLLRPVMAKDAEKHVILEYISVGNYVKVSAIDPKTRIEVSIVGDPKQGEEALKRIAVRKLHYVLKKKSRGK